MLLVVQRVFEIIHPDRRNLTAIRGYVRLGGLPDNPRTDPQDRAWFGPHDRLFTEEETVPIDFKPGPDFGAFFFPCLFCLPVSRVSHLALRVSCFLSRVEISTVLTRSFGTVWCWGWDGAGDLDGPDVDPIWEKMPNRSTTTESVKVRHRRDLQWV